MLANYEPYVGLRKVYFPDVRSRGNINDVWENQTNLFNKTKFTTQKIFFACNKIPLLTINNLII